MGRSSAPKRASATRRRSPTSPACNFGSTRPTAPQAPTKGRVLDHIGFDVKDLKAFVKKLEANNIKLDRPYSVNDQGIGIAFITDPWGTNIEINERPSQTGGPTTRR